MPKKRGKQASSGSGRPVRITKLTNLFLGVALGTLIGYYGGTPNLIIAGIAVLIIIILASMYGKER